MRQKNLKQIVAEQPFPQYSEWWDIGQEFSGFMSEAIVSQWSQLHGNDGDLAMVEKYVSEYLRVVFGRQAHVSLVTDFVTKRQSLRLQSGEFDALSYAFFRSAFELIQAHSDAYTHSIEKERRSFTKRVGKRFFRLVSDHLSLDLPAGLNDERSFLQLKECIQRVGGFLRVQGYLRDYFDFSFSVDVTRANGRIRQIEADFLKDLHRHGVAYALYEMGHPVILPSAVYLYHTVGEAQHHSSRTIEELFEMVGYEARESEDFDPSDHPSDQVVEFWEIRRVIQS
jgi:hypothetical protein